MKFYEANRKQLNSVLCNYVSNRAEVYAVEKKKKCFLNIVSLTTLHVMASASINCFITKQGTDHPFFPVIRSTQNNKSHRNALVWLWDLCGVVVLVEDDECYHVMRLTVVKSERVIQAAQLLQSGMHHSCSVTGNRQCLRFSIMNYGSQPLLVPARWVKWDRSKSQTCQSAARQEVLVKQLQEVLQKES